MPDCAEHSTAAEEIGRLWDEGIDSGRAVEGEAELASIRSRLVADTTESGG